MKISDSTRSQSAATSPAAAQLQGDQAPLAADTRAKEDAYRIATDKATVAATSLGPMVGVAGGPVVATCREMQKWRRPIPGGG